MTGVQTCALPISLGATRRELLDMTKIGPDGELYEATIPWVRSTESKVSGLETELMGYIHVCGRKLIVEVNSARRARAFRLLISNTPAATARYRRTRKVSPQGMFQAQSDATDLFVTRH